VPRLDDGETTTILYKIKGEGEYHPTDAQVFYNTGGKLGALATKTEIMEEASEVEAPTPPTEPEDEDSEKAVDRPIEDYKTEEDYEPEESEPEE
jgi:outer membrane biosynthesis protein TonB